MFTINKFFIIVLSFFLIMSCTKNTENVSQNESKINNKLLTTFVNPYSDLGEFHNNGLDSVYAYIKSHKDSIKDYDDLAEITLNGIKSYIKNTVNDYCEESVNKGLIIAKQYFDFFNDTTKISPYDSLINSNYFNTNQLHYFEQMYNLYKSKLSPNELYDSLNVLDFEMYSSLDSIDSKPLLMISSVLGKSYDYWNNPENVNKWENLFDDLNNTLGKTSATESTLGDIGEVDFVSAGAAVIPCIASTFGYLNCVGGAALGGSVAEGVVKLVEWIF